MNEERTERLAALTATADRLAERFAARADQHDRANTFPHENFRDLHEAGFLALTIPAEYGGGGIDTYELAVIQERLARGDGSTALAATMHLSLLGRIGETGVWPAERFARVCRDVVERGALVNSAHSEPEMGSPSRGGLPTTVATRTASGWRLNGRKRWASLAPALGWIAVLATARSDDGQPRRATFLVPGDAPGLRVDETWDNLGMRATGSHDIVLTDVEVPADAEITEAKTDVPGEGRAWGPLAVGAVYLGIADAAREAAVRYANERVPTGMSGPIAELQTIQHRVAEIALLLLQARTVLFDTAQGWVAQPDQREAMTWRLAAAKYLATNNAIQVTDLALRVVGANALSRRMPLERYFRDVRSGLSQPPMDDAALTAIGRAALGLS